MKKHFVKPEMDILYLTTDAELAGNPIMDVSTNIIDDVEINGDDLFGE